MNHKVSIITPAYNASQYIIDTIKSVKAQTLDNWEMIIVDDGSQDETKALIKREMAGEPRIKLIECDQNRGPAAARNIAINRSTGRYLAFLDSDDQWLAHKLERQLAFMAEKDIAFSFSDYRIMKEEGEWTDAVFQVPTKLEYKDLLKNTIIGTLTVMLDKSKVGHVQMALHRDCSEDFGLWLSLLKKGFVAYGLNEELAIYRKCEHSLSSNKLKSIKKTWNTYRKIEKISILRASWYLSHYSFNALKKHAKII